MEEKRKSFLVGKFFFGEETNELIYIYRIEISIPNRNNQLTIAVVWCDELMDHLCGAS